MDVETLTLTTNHAASSYGQPVLLLDGEAYGPADMTPAGMTGAELVTTWAARFIRPLSPEVRALLVTDAAPLAALAPAMLDKLRAMLRMYDLKHMTPVDYYVSYWREVRELVRQAEEANR